MTAAYFEEHPTDPDKVILRKPKHDFGEPWSPVSIGVDMTEAGAYVVGIYALDKDTSQIFYAKHHPAPQRTWVGLTDDELLEIYGWRKAPMLSDFIVEEAKQELLGALRKVEAKLKEKNT